MDKLEKLQNTNFNSTQILTCTFVHLKELVCNLINFISLGTKVKAHTKLQSIKDYIGYPQEILNNTLIEDLYDGIEVTNNTFYQNSINMGKWSIVYSWSKLRDQIDKTDWKRHANPAVVNAYYSGIENSIQFPAGILQVIFQKDEIIRLIQHYA